MRRLFAALAAALSLAAATGASPVAAQAQGNENAVVRLASQTSWLEPGGEWVLRLQIAGVPDPQDVDVRVTVHRRVDSRSRFALTLDGKGLSNAIESTVGRLSELPTDAGGAIYYRLKPEDLGLTATGVYPVQVVLSEHRGAVLDRLVTHLVYVARPPDGPKLAVAWIVPVHAPPSVAPNGSRRLPTGDDLSTLTDVLQSPAYVNVPVVLAPTPETLAALAASRDGTARSVLDAIRAAVDGRQVIARPYVPVDVRALVDGGLADELALQRRRGRDVTSAALGSGVNLDTTTWLADEPLDNESVARLRDLQVDRVVVDERTLEPVRLNVTLAQPFKLDAGSSRPIDAAVSDAGLVAHFRNRGDQVLAAHQFLADLAVLWQDAPQKERGVVVATPRSWQASRSFLDAALEGLVQSPLVQPVSLDDVFDRIDFAQTSRRAPLVRELAAVERGVLGVPPSRVADDRRRIEAIGSSLPVDSDRYDALDRHLLAAESADLTPRTRRSYLGGLESRIRAFVGDVVVPNPRTVTLTAREGEVPLTFQNRSDETITVRAQLESDRLEFPDGGQRSLELPPRNTTVRVRVRARTAGAFPLRVSLVTPQNDLVLATTRLTVRSTAASGVGVGLSAGAGVFLLLWWARHLVRGRRARKLVPA